MNKVDQYRIALHKTQDWIPYLLAESSLPGPRANLELAQAVADEGNEALFQRLLSYGPERAQTNTPEEFLALCGTIGLGKLIAHGHQELLTQLRLLASDPRWRVREGVAMALQRLGDQDMNTLLREMTDWSNGSWLEQRAAAAALCEPRLLTDKNVARQVLQILDVITTGIYFSTDRSSEDFKILKKGLGYCWSVAVAALPSEGKVIMEKWLIVKDPDIRWIMRHNLKKKRLCQMDVDWTEKWQNVL
jgi:hypothetical protein